MFTKYPPFPKCLFSSDVVVALPSLLLKIPNIVRATNLHSTILFAKLVIYDSMFQVMNMMAQNFPVTEFL